MGKRKAKIVWSAQALENLRDIAAYIRQYNPRAARRIRQQITDATRRLAQFPLSGRIVPEFPDDNYREVIVRDYRIIYEPTQGKVEILTVVHGRRDLPSLRPRDA